MADSKEDSLDYEAIRKIDTFSEVNASRWTTLHQHRIPTDDPLINGYNYIFVTCPRLAVLVSEYQQALNAINYKNADAMAIQYYNNTARWLGLPLAGDNMEENNGDPDYGGLKNIILFDKRITKVLSGGRGISPFIPILTNNAVKFSATDSQLDTIDYCETWNKHKIVLGTSMQDSRLAGTIQFDFMEDSSLSVMKLCYLWKKYIENAFLGNIVTATSLKSNNITGSGAFGASELDYAASIYHFSVLPDGETLSYWTKYTGVYPTQVPWSVVSSDDGSPSLVPSVPITFQYSYKEEMNGHILNDFNLVSSLGNTETNRKAIDTYDKKYFEGSTVNLCTISQYPQIVAKRPTDEGKFRREAAFSIKFKGGT